MAAFRQMLAVAALLGLSGWAVPAHAQCAAAEDNTSDAPAPCVVGSAAAEARAEVEARAVQNEIANRFMPRRAPGLPGRLSTQGSNAVTGWNAWGEFTYLLDERDADPADNFDFEGDVSSFILGADLPFAEGRGVFGGYLKADNSVYDIEVDDSTFETEGVGIGLYAGYGLTDNWFADAMVSYSGNDNDVDATVGTDYSFDGSQVVLSGNVTGYFFVQDVWRISPSFGVLSSFTSEDAHLDNLSVAIDEDDDNFTSVSAGVQLGRTFFTDTGRYFEPYGGVSLSYDVKEADYPETFGSIYEPDRLNMSANVGLTGQLGEAATFDIGGGLGRIGNSDDSTVSATARFSMSF